MVTDNITKEKSLKYNKRFSKIFWPRLFGYDFFISFTLGSYPRGTQSYASDLARRLREKDFTVFYSEEAAPKGAELDSTLLDALYRSRILIVLVNEGALIESKWVRKEVEAFRCKRPNRLIIPINIDDAINKHGIKVNAALWLKHESIIWIPETEHAVRTGIVSDEIINGIEITPHFLKANTRLRWTIFIIIYILLSLTIFAWWQTMTAEKKRISATLSVIAGLQEQGAFTTADELSNNEPGIPNYVKANTGLAIYESGTILNPEKRAFDINELLLTTNDGKGKIISQGWYDGVGISDADGIYDPIHCDELSRFSSIIPTSDGERFVLLSDESTSISIMSSKDCSGGEISLENWLSDKHAYISAVAITDNNTLLLGTSNGKIFSRYNDIKLLSNSLVSG